MSDANSRSFPGRLSLRDGRRMLCIEVDEIAWIEAAGNYVQIYCGRKAHLVRHTIKAITQKLDPDRFVRVRPSAIVAVASATALNARVGGDYVVVLRDGTQIRTSRAFREQVEHAFAGVPGTAHRRWATRRRAGTEPTSAPRSCAADAVPGRRSAAGSSRLAAS